MGTAYGNHGVSEQSVEKYRGILEEVRDFLPQSLKVEETSSILNKNCAQM